jgi:hypothetical protein
MPVGGQVAKEEYSRIDDFLIVGLLGRKSQTVLEKKIIPGYRVII